MLLTFVILLFGAASIVFQLRLTFFCFDGRNEIALGAQRSLVSHELANMTADLAMTNATSLITSSVPVSSSNPTFSTGHSSSQTIATAISPENSSLTTDPSVFFHACMNDSYLVDGNFSGIARYDDHERKLIYFASKKVDGWSGELTFDMVVVISNEQRHRKVISRSVGEVGVHQGKSFLWVDSVSFVYDRVFALDVFDLQQYNTDHSGGSGLSVDSFWRNVGPIIGDNNRNHIEIMRGSSTLVTACNFTSRHLAPVRLFSIDGSHTGDATYSDCCLAASVLSRGGCMFVDDYLNPGWLGVHEGVHRFLYENRVRFAPLAIVAGKFWICDVDYVEFYRQALLRELPAAIRMRSLELGRTMKITVQSRMYGIQMVFVEGS